MAVKIVVAVKPDLISLRGDSYVCTGETLSAIRQNHIRDNISLRNRFMHTENCHLEKEGSSVSHFEELLIESLSIGMRIFSLIIGWMKST
jgi:hypothetical protein